MGSCQVTSEELSLMTNHELRTVKFAPITNQEYAMEEPGAPSEVSGEATTPLDTSAADRLHQGQQ
jgi:hypothetical protein